MAILSRLILPITVQENGYLRPIADAQVYVYDNLSDGTSPVSDDGTLSGSAVQVQLYSDRLGTIPLTQPVVSDANGMVFAFVRPGLVHVKMVLPDGSDYGMSYLVVAPDLEGISKDVLDGTISYTNPEVANLDGFTSVKVVSLIGVAPGWRGYKGQLVLDNDVLTPNLWIAINVTPAPTPSWLQVATL